MTLPSSVRVGFQDFAVEPYYEAEAPANGEFRRDAGLIKLDFGLPPQRVAATLLHEVLHACFDLAGLSEADDEERIVHGMTNVMAQVIRDNPAFVAYLTEALQPSP